MASTLAAGVPLLAAGLLVQTGSALAAIGDITEYTVPTASSSPWGIVAGPDGNLWFTESSSNKVAKITTSGAITEYTVPTAASNPRGIVAGPDGNLWFAEAGTNIVAKVTTSGVFTEYPTPTAASFPYSIAVGSDGNLWFTEFGASKVAKTTTSGAVTEYTIPTANSNPVGIAAGPDGNLWVTEYGGNKVAKVTTAGTFTEYTVPTASSSPYGVAAGPDGNLWITEGNGNKVAVVTTSGAFVEYVVPTAASLPLDIAAGPDGNLWFSELLASKVASITTAGAITEYTPPTANNRPRGITAGPDGKVWFAEFNVGKVAKIVTAPNCTATGVPNARTASSTQQYTFANSDGASWQEIDATSLRVTCIVSVNQSTLLTANADLFTANAGFNQDLGIFVSDNGGADQLLAWKESGGFAGTFSPNAAFVQSRIIMTAGHTYLFKLKWKTNKPASGATIFAGAGGGPSYSPTSLVAETFPSTMISNFAMSTQQYTLPSSDGATWQTIDATNLSTTVSPSASTTAVLGANVDLFTGKAGYNQDIGIFVSDNGGLDSLVAWKESGGFAGTFSPNAAFVKGTLPMTAGHTYVFKLKWKTNRTAVGATIYAAAGAGPVYSPTSLLVETIASGANPYSAVTTSQYNLPNSNGATWTPIDAALNVTVTPSADAISVAGGNADLWTANAGYNQDIALFVSDNGGADVLLAWKESGGFAGTFSPNAAFVQTTYQMTSGHTYVFKLKWKTNKNAPGATIYAAAGGPAPFSPTRLTIELTA